MIQFQILQTTSYGLYGRQKGEITNEILGVKGLKNELLTRQKYIEKVKKSNCLDAMSSSG